MQVPTSSLKNLVPNVSTACSRAYLQTPLATCSCLSVHRLPVYLDSWDPMSWTSSSKTAIESGGGPSSSRRISASSLKLDCTDLQNRSLCQSRSCPGSIFFSTRRGPREDCWDRRHRCRRFHRGSRRWAREVRTDELKLITWQASRVCCTSPPPWLVNFPPQRCWMCVCVPIPT